MNILLALLATATAGALALAVQFRREADEAYAELYREATRADVATHFLKRCDQLRRLHFYRLHGRRPEPFPQAEEVFDELQRPDDLILNDFNDDPHGYEPPAHRSRFSASCSSESDVHGG